MRFIVAYVKIVMEFNEKNLTWVIDFPIAWKNKSFKSKWHDASTLIFKCTIQCILVLSLRIKQQANDGIGQLFQAIDFSIRNFAFLQHLRRSFIHVPNAFLIQSLFIKETNIDTLWISSIDTTYYMKKKYISTEWDRKVFYMHSTQFVFTMGKVGVSVVFM